MSNTSDLTYENIDNPYDNNMERSGDGITSDVQGSVVGGDETVDGQSVGGTANTEITTGQSFSNIWIKTWIKSSNYKPGVQGFFLDGTTGNAEFANLSLSGGDISYGKTSFSDSTNAGYFISSDGVYFGAAADATKLKYTLATGTLDLIGTISSRSTATLAAAIDASGDLITDLINARLDSSSKYILSDFTFGTTDYAGALKTGDITWNTSTGVVNGGTGIVINKNGIVGASSGTTTFSITTAGDAYFSGELAAATGTFGTITSTSGGGITILNDGDIELQASGGAWGQLSWVNTGGANKEWFFAMDTTTGGGLEEDKLSLLAGDNNVNRKLAFGSVADDPITVYIYDNLSVAGTLSVGGSSVGTVTSVATTGAITGGTITTTGTIAHSTSSGYKHVPSSGSSQQFLKYSSSGTATWEYLGATANAQSIVPTSGTANLGSNVYYWDRIYAGIVYMDDLYDRYQGYVDCHQDFRPSSNVSYDLGSSSYAWAEAHIKSLRFDIGGASNPTTSGQMMYYDGSSKGFRGYVNGFTGQFDLSGV